MTSAGSASGPVQGVPVGHRRLCLWACARSVKRTWQAGQWTSASRASGTASRRTCARRARPTRARGSAGQWASAKARPAETRSGASEPVPRVPMEGVLEWASARCAGGAHSTLDRCENRLVDGACGWAQAPSREGGARVPPTHTAGGTGPRRRMSLGLRAGPHAADKPSRRRAGAGPLQCAGSAWSVRCALRCGSRALRCGSRSRALRCGSRTAVWLYGAPCGVALAHCGVALAQRCGSMVRALANRRRVGGARGRVLPKPRCTLRQCAPRMKGGWQRP